MQEWAYATVRGLRGRRSVSLLRERDAEFGSSARVRGSGRGDSGNGAAPRHMGPAGGISDGVRDFALFGHTSTAPFKKGGGWAGGILLTIIDVYASVAVAQLGIRPFPLSGLLGGGYLSILRPGGARLFLGFL